MIYFDEYRLFVDVEVTDHKRLGEEIGKGFGNRSPHYLVNIHFYSMPKKESRLTTIMSYQPYPAVSFEFLKAHAESIVKKYSTKQSREGE